MKLISIKIVITVVLAVPLLAQTDSVIETENVSMTFFKPLSYKLMQNDTIYTYVPDEITGIESVMFLPNDSLLVKNENDFSVKMKLQQVHELNQYKEQVNTFLAAGLGAGGGAIIAGVIAYALYENDDKGPFAGMFEELERLGSAGKVAIIGALGGAIIGAVVSVIVNQVSIDLFSVPEKDKKAKLIKFHRDK